MKNLVYTFFLAAILAASTYGQNMNAKDQALEAVLEKFASEHGLSGTEMAAMLAKYLFDQPLFSKKGNMGVIDGSAHVDLNAPKNRLLLENGKRSWDGKSRAEPEIVVLVRQDETIRPIADGDATRAGILLIKFSPDKVQIIDPVKGEGGFYDRAAAQPTAEKK